MTKLASALAAALLATLTVATPAQAWTDGPHAAPEPWTPQCADGDRDTATQWAAIGDFSAPRQVTWKGGRVELHYNGTARCAWGSYAGEKAAAVYLDRSTDGGAHWTGPLGSASKGKSAYTGVFNDNSPSVSRACASPQGHLHCTDWY